MATQQPNNHKTPCNVGLLAHICAPEDEYHAINPRRGQLAGNRSWIICPLQAYLSVFCQLVFQRRDWHNKYTIRPLICCVGHTTKDAENGRRFSL